MKETIGLYKRMFKFFDRLEDRVRAGLSNHPMIYAIIGGVAIVVFWRGVWGFMDLFPIFDGLYGMIWTTIASSLVLMVTGIFISYFVTDRIILSGMKHEKKVAEKTQEELAEEEEMIARLAVTLERIGKELQEIKQRLYMVEIKEKEISETIGIEERVDKKS
jgi:TRAP-type C4-dicarboxylate transport system permease large subunit